MSRATTATAAPLPRPTPPDALSESATTTAPGRPGSSAGRPQGRRYSGLKPSRTEEVSSPKNRSNLRLQELQNGCRLKANMTFLFYFYLFSKKLKVSTCASSFQLHHSDFFQHPSGPSPKRISHPGPWPAPLTIRQTLPKNSSSTATSSTTFARRASTVRGCRQE